MRLGDPRLICECKETPAELAGNRANPRMPGGKLITNKGSKDGEQVDSIN